MRNREIVQTGSRVLLLLGQLVVLIFCIGYIEYVYYTNILPDKNAKDTFQQTDCFILSKRLSTKGRVIHQYRADFLISYTVNDDQYNHWISGNGLDISYSRNREQQETILNDYSIGGNYPCWYSPENPELAILVLRHDWLGTFPLMVPSVVGVITLYYFLKNLFQLLGYARITVKEVAKEKKRKKNEKNNSD